MTTAMENYLQSGNIVPSGAQGVEAIAALATRAAGPTMVGEDGKPEFLVYTSADGDTVQVIDLVERRKKHDDPEKSGAYTVTDVDSFVTYFRKHAEPGAEVWVSNSGARAVLNAHGDGAGAAGWRPENHVLTLRLTHSAEWLRWQGVSGKLMSQDVFAEWLEGAARDILVPDFATVLEVAQSLEAKTKVDFKAAYRTADGQRAFRYEETTTAKAGQKGELEIPSHFEIALRPFVGQLPVQMVARFRYRIQSEALHLGIVIDRTPEILEAAVDQVVEQLSADLDRGIVLRA